jgi:coproporphyrinogen III oxidase-like Fe-S oxidoreductase
MARNDVEQALICGVPHFSAYQLTILPNTVFWSKPLRLPVHDLFADIHRRLLAFLRTPSTQRTPDSAASCTAQGAG